MNKKEKGFDYVYRQRKLKENKIVIGLRESEKLIGQLYPVLVDEEGKVLDGQHRLKANPDWRREVVKGVDSERKRAMIRLHANWHRREVYKGQVLAELAKITGWKGGAPYAAFLGCSVRTAQRYLPQKYKQRQRFRKRQLSLSEQREMVPQETKRRVELLEEERKLSWDISSTFPIDPPSWVLPGERRSYNLMVMGIEAGDWNVEGKTKEEIMELLKTRILEERESIKKTRIHNYLYNLSDEQVIAYVQKVSPKTRLRVEPIAKRLLDDRRKWREREAKKVLFKNKVDELYARFKQITVEFTDGTKIPLNFCLIGGQCFYEGNKHVRIVRPGDKKYPEHYLKKVILPAIAKEMLGFDKWGESVGGLKT